MPDAAPLDMATHATHWGSRPRHVPHDSSLQASFAPLDFILLALLALALAFLAQSDVRPMLST